MEKPTPKSNSAKKIASYIAKQCSCGKYIEYARKHLKSCSPACSKHILGGPRKGSGRSKQGTYHGIHCDSLYELCFLMYHLDKNIPIVRNTQGYPYTDIDGTKHLYYPDFRVNGVLHEIKGWDSGTHQKKIAAIKDEPIVVVLGKENKLYIDYATAKTKLSYSKLTLAYHVSPHILEHICEWCNKTFTSTSKKSVMCSKQCCGKAFGSGRKRIMVPPADSATASSG